MESLGGVESPVSQPFSMTHASILLEKRPANGITPQLIRLSVGTKILTILIADWQQALREEDYSDARVVASASGIPLPGGR